MTVPKVISKGTSFFQGSGGRKGKPFDKEYWKDKEYYNCHEKGHPASYCKKKNKDNDDQSIASTKSTKSTVSILKKEVKRVKKKFRLFNLSLFFAFI